MSTLETLHQLCRTLHLPTAAASVSESLLLAHRENWSLEQFLASVLEQEVEGRRQRRVQRLLAQSHLPEGKSFARLDAARLPLRRRRLLPSLRAGDLLARAENRLLFGLPGTGTSHLAAALGQDWVQAGHPVLFTPTFKLVGRLLRAKRDYELERELRRLDSFEVVILDDIGSVQQSRDEMEVLFTFLAERYERRSVVITSNLVFSEWGQLFKDPLTTAAAIDRVVHHSIILEFGSDMRSMRAEAAARRNRVDPSLGTDAPLSAAAPP
ncbi:MAG: IS21-like element helper ATPase IstB [Ardenticatenaceae bacterium]|nr:IS21-like element helper ATPase IstB [Ardenticatenaceae bacterium]